MTVADRCGPTARVEGNGFLPRFYTDADYERIRTCEMRPGFTMHLFRKELSPGR